MKTRKNFKQKYMKKTFTIILSVILLASCANNDFEETQKLINTCSTYNTNSISKIETKICASKYTKEEAMEVYSLYNEFLNKVGKHITDSINTLLFSSDVDYLKIYENTERKSIELQNFGIFLYNIEGGVDYDILPLHITILFLNYLSPCEKELASIQQNEILNPILIDAGIIVPCSEIASRLHETEIILQDNTDSICAPEIREYQHRYLILLMFGSDNTPAFNWNTHEMNADFKNEINNYINEYPDSPCSQIFSEYITILKGNNFKENKESRKFIEKLIKSFY